MPNIKLIRYQTLQYFESKLGVMGKAAALWIHSTSLETPAKGPTNTPMCAFNVERVRGEPNKFIKVSELNWHMRIGIW